VTPLCVVETGETRSTRILPKHIENSSDLRPGTNRANDAERWVFGASRLWLLALSVRVNLPKTRPRSE
jgi:hypothetical protein